MDYKIDWLTLTLKPEGVNTTYSELKEYADMCPLETWLFKFLELFKIKNEFRFKSGSVQHYNFMYTYNGISIAFANSFLFPQQGLMVRFSAEGIAFYEKYRKAADKNWNWITFLKEFFSLGCYGLKCKCTRIDLAFDDISYDDNRLISLEKIKKAIQNKEVVSLFKNKENYYNPLEEYKEITCIEKLNSKGDIIGDTINFGNRKSSAYLRFYDKLKEQLGKKQEIDEKIKHWVRMEFEFKNNRAMAVCDSLILLNSDEFGQYFAQVVNRYLRFVKPNGDGSHNYRCKSRKWWRNIVGTVEKARLAENKAVKNRYKSSMRWLERTVYPTLWAVLHCKNIDSFLTDVQQAGFENHRAKHDDIINDYITNKPEEDFKGLDIHKVSTDSFKQLVKELETAAYSNKMKSLGLELCKVLELEKEFEKFHNVRIDGMQERRIFEFKNRQMLISDDLKAIDDVFRHFE